MHATLSEEDCTSSGYNTYVMEKIARSKVKDSIGWEVDKVFAERTQAEVQMQTEKTLLNLLQLGINAVLNGVETASARSWNR